MKRIIAGLLLCAFAFTPVIASDLTDDGVVMDFLTPTPTLGLALQATPGYQGPSWKSVAQPRPYLGIVPENGGFWSSAWRITALSVSSFAVNDPMERPGMYSSALDYYLTTGSPDLMNHNRELFLEFTNHYTFGVDSNLYRWHYKR